MSTTFNTCDVTAGSRRDYWHDAMTRSGLPPLRENHRVEGDLDAQLRVGRLGVVRVAEATTPASDCMRTGRMARQFDDDLYQLEVLTSGNAVVEQHSRQAWLEAGDVLLIDPTRPVRFRTSDTTNVTVLFPRTMLPLKAADFRQVAGLAIPGDRGTGALMSSLVRGLPAALDGIRTDEAGRIGAAVVELLETALFARLDRPPTPQSRHSVLRQHVYAYIDGNLHRPDLSPVSIAAAHHISLRHLHKLFETEPTTVSAWIRRRRLEQCAHDLRNTSQSHRSAASIAAKWGLTNPASFSRIFKSAYGMSASDYREAKGVH